MNKSASISSSDIYASYSYAKEPAEELLDFNKNRHLHDCFEILFVISGEGSLLVEGSRFRISPGTLIVVRPFEYHSIKLSENVPYERYVVNFSKSALVSDTQKLFESLIRDEETSGKYYSFAALPENIISMFERFDSAANLPQNEKDIFMRLILSELCIMLSACGGEQMTHSEGELGARVIRYLNENISRDVTLDKLARRFFVSKYYLCRAFKKHNGISVHGYINRKRVMYAKQLIEMGETASSAAYKVGFGDYSAFYRAYVKIVGKAPSAN